MEHSQASSLQGLRLAVNTQTPLVRFREEAIVPTTGGVTRMLQPLLRSWLEAGILDQAEWVALGAGKEAGDREAVIDGIRLSFVELSPEQQRSYAIAKEHLWSLLNESPPTTGEEPTEQAWGAFDAYQERAAEALKAAAERMGGRADALYVHDFQQIGVGRAWEGRRDVPKIFHLHTPFPRSLPDAWKAWFIDELRAYDAVVVSTRRYADNLLSAGLPIPVHVVRPFIDPRSQPEPSADDVAHFRERYHLREGERVILNVARMDPMKAQDRLLRAFARILRDEPDARLVLVGNGSFSSSKRGGLGLSKGQQWRAACEAIARDLGVAERVVFTGHLDDALLPAAYASCDVFCLPSTREGFGLAAIEAWRHAKPIVVSERAGVAELVRDGENGMVVDASDDERLAQRLLDIIRDPEGARAMGKRGRAASAEATLDQGAAALERILSKIVAAPEARAVAH